VDVPAARTGMGTAITLPEVKSKCAADEAAVTVGDEGKTLLFDGTGKDDWGRADTTVLACILGELSSGPHDGPHQTLKRNSTTSPSFMT